MKPYCILYISMMILGLNAFTTLTHAAEAPKKIQNNAQLSTTDATLNLLRGKKTASFLPGALRLEINPRSIRLNQAIPGKRVRQNLVLNIARKNKITDIYNFSVPAAAIKQSLDLKADSIETDLGLHTFTYSSQCSLGEDCYTDPFTGRESCHTIYGSQYITQTDHLYDEAYTLKFLVPGTSEEKARVQGIDRRTVNVTSSADNCQ